MIKPNAKLIKLTSAVNSNDKNLIAGAIEFLREEHPYEGAIGSLASLYDKTGEIIIRKAIEGFMNDLKFQPSAQEVISEIKRGWKPDTTRMLVASCWQSGLDYSMFAYDFAEVLLSGDYATAIECFTILSESVHVLTGDTKSKIISLFSKNQLLEDSEKYALTQELRSILES